MAKICASFYNGLYDPDNSQIMPGWYEGFFNGMREQGNELLLFSLREFQKDYNEIDDKTKKEIMDFNPDLYISFNNVFYDMSFLECPILVYEADSPIYWSNKSRLYSDERCMYAIWGKSEAEQLESIYGIKKKNIHLVKPFTSIRNNDSVSPNVAISFVGSRFGVNRNNEMGQLENESSTATNEYWRCLKYVVEHPYTTKEEVILENRITNKRVQDMIDVPGMLMMMSSEQRVRVLSAVVDLGLELYGTRTWLERYHFDTRLNAAYVDKTVYSLAHNQDIYNKSKIGLNISHFQAKDGFPWRVLDIMASNACLVTDGWCGVKTYFPNLPIPTYNDEHEARTLCQALLKDEERRLEIVSRCQEVVEQDYRFENHLAELENITKLCLRA